MTQVVTAQGAGILQSVEFLRNTIQWCKIPIFVPGFMLRPWKTRGLPMFAGAIFANFDQNELHLRHVIGLWRRATVTQSAIQLQRMRVRGGNRGQLSSSLANS
jgi:hypothetical protein